jgi:hypothetical protein
MTQGAKANAAPPTHMAQPLRAIYPTVGLVLIMRPSPNTQLNDATKAVQQAIPASAKPHLMRRIHLALRSVVSSASVMILPPSAKRT